MYADDLALLADNEIDLQLMLDNLSKWCLAGHMLINPSKCQIVHFRQRSVPGSDFLFRCESLAVCLSWDYFDRVFGL